MAADLVTDVSVIVPTYNGERHLGSALSSLSEGQDRPAQVIVVDDGSSDASVEIAASFADQLPLEILRPTPRRSWMAMTNIGLAEATSSWTAILHQDDRWEPGRAAHIRSHVDDHASLVLMDTAFIDAQGRSLGAWRLPKGATSAPGGADVSVASLLWVQNWVAVPSATFRTVDARAVGGLDEDLWYTADWDLWLKLARQGGVRATSRTGGAFRIHGSSQTVTGSQDLAGFRHQMNVVQERHGWALDLAPDPDVLRRAGALSTETNVALAGLFHRQQIEARSWARACRSAGPHGVMTYLRSSALAARLGARVRSQLTGRLSPAPVP